MCEVVTKSCLEWIQFGSKRFNDWLVFCMALDAHEITLNEVDASLENLSIEESIVGAPILH